MRLTRGYTSGNYSAIEQKYDCVKSGELGFYKAINKLGKLEDIEERLSKYKEIGINGLIDLFENLTDEDIEYVVQLAFKKEKIIYDIRW